MSFNQQSYSKNACPSNKHQGYSSRNHKKNIHNNYHHYNYYQQEGEGNSSWKHHKQNNNNSNSQIKDNRDEMLGLDGEMAIELNPMSRKYNSNNNDGYYGESQKDSHCHQHKNSSSKELSKQSHPHFKTQLQQQQMQQQQALKNNQNDNLCQKYNPHAFKQLNCQLKQNIYNSNFPVNQNRNYYEIRREPFNSFYPYLNQNEQLFINQNSHNVNSSNLIGMNQHNHKKPNRDNNNNSTHSNTNSNIIFNLDQILSFNSNSLHHMNIPEFYPNDKRTMGINQAYSFNNTSTNQDTLQTNSVNSNSESQSSIVQISPIKSKVIPNNQSSLSSVPQSPTKSEANQYPYSSPIDQMNTAYHMPMSNNTPTRHQPLSNSPLLRYPMTSDQHYFNQRQYSPNLLYNYNMPQCNYNQMYIPNSRTDNNNTIDIKSHLHYNNSNPMSYFYHNRHNPNMFAVNPQVNVCSNIEPAKTTNPHQHYNRKVIRSVQSEKNLFSIIGTDVENESIIMQKEKCETENNNNDEDDSSLFQIIQVKVALPNNQTKFFDCKINERNIACSVVKFASDNSIDNQKVITLLIYKITEVIGTVNQILKYNLSLKEKIKLIQIQKIVNDRNGNSKGNRKDANAKSEANDNLNTSSMFEFEANEEFQSLFKEKDDDEEHISLSMTQ